MLLHCLQVFSKVKDLWLFWKSSCFSVAGDMPPPFKRWEAKAWNTSSFSLQQKVLAQDSPAVLCRILSQERRLDTLGPSVLEANPLLWARRWMAECVSTPSELRRIGILFGKWLPNRGYWRSRRGNGRRFSRGTILKKVHQREIRCFPVCPIAIIIAEVPLQLTHTHKPEAFLLGEKWNESLTQPIVC